MATVDELLAAIDQLVAADLERWIENRWVRPARAGGAWEFSDIDVARVRLICEMRYDLAIDEEALPVVLSLLDQVYALRGRLRRLASAVEAQPDSVRAEIEAALARLERAEDI